MWRPKQIYIVSYPKRKLPSISQVTNGTLMQFLRRSQPTEVAPSADGDSELLKWATDTYGGVTSFTTARHPISIIFTGMTGKIRLSAASLALTSCVLSVIQSFVKRCLFQASTSRDPPHVTCSWKHQQINTSSSWACSRHPMSCNHVT